MLSPWSRLTHPAVVAAAAALIVIGAKCWMIGRYGSVTPFWDQWDAEAATLYPPYLGGTLGLADLLAAHNEHRILITRLWSLLLFELAGHWDPLLQMLANALLLGGFVALLIALLRPVLDPRGWIGVAIGATLLFALPIGWENTLAGFQSQWYFLLLLGVGGLALIVDAPALTPRWWLATLLLTLSYFGMASGALGVAAAAALGLVQIVTGRRCGLREWAGIATLGIIAAVLVYWTPAPAGHGPLRAHSVGAFAAALIETASWPVPGRLPFAIKLGCALLIQAPLLWFAIATIRQRPPLHDPRWRLVALGGWIALQFAAIALGRAALPTSQRYADLFVIGLLLNAACWPLLLDRSTPQAPPRRFAAAAASVWLLVVGAGLTLQMVRHSLPEMAYRGTTGRTQTANLRAYLATGDIAALTGKPRLDIPYPDPQRLAQLVTQPAVRAILPPDLIGDLNSGARTEPRGVARWTAAAVAAFRLVALNDGVLLIPIGLVLLAPSLLALRRRARSNVTSPA